MDQAWQDVLPSLGATDHARDTAVMPPTVLSAIPSESARSYKLFVTLNAATEEKRD